MNPKALFALQKKIAENQFKMDYFLRPFSVFYFPFFFFPWSKQSLKNKLL